MRVSKSPRGKSKGIFQSASAGNIRPQTEIPSFLNKGKSEWISHQSEKRSVRWIVSVLGDNFTMGEIIEKESYRNKKDDEIEEDLPGW